MRPCRSRAPALWTTPWGPAPWDVLPDFLQSVPGADSVTNVSPGLQQAKQGLFSNVVDKTWLSRLVVHPEGGTCYRWDEGGWEGLEAAGPQRSQGGLPP